MSIGEKLQNVGTVAWSTGCSAASGISGLAVRSFQLGGRHVGVIAVAAATLIVLTIYLLARRCFSSSPTISQPLTHSDGGDEPICSKHSDIEEIRTVLTAIRQQPKPEQISISTSNGSMFSSSSTAAAISSTSTPANDDNIVDHPDFLKISDLIFIQLQRIPVTINVPTRYIQMEDEAKSKLFKLANPIMAFEGVKIHQVSIMTLKGAQKYGYETPGYGCFIESEGNFYTVRVPGGDTNFAVVMRKDVERGLFIQIDPALNQNQRRITLSIPALFVKDSLNNVEKIDLSGIPEKVSLNREGIVVTSLDITLFDPETSQRHEIHIPAGFGASVKLTRETSN